jgi:response regulator RpfG family c-di-GMP phosphodiesterase
MKSRLLIVDDKPANLLALEALLSAKYDLVPAHSGQEALKLLRNSAVDVILLDIEMPGMDGYETTRLIKQMPDRQNIPIILISGVFTDDPNVKKGYEVGAVDYFTKPFDPGILRTKVSIYASLSAKDAEIREKDARIKALEEMLTAKTNDPSA